MIQRFSLTRFRTSELLTFAVQLIFSIFLHIHISKASILFISVLDIVHVSAAYKATLHTRHLTIRFLKSRFILLVRIFSLREFYFCSHLFYMILLFCEARLDLSFLVDESVSLCLFMCLCLCLCVCVCGSARE